MTIHSTTAAAEVFQSMQHGASVVPAAEPRPEAAIFAAALAARGPAVAVQVSAPAAPGPWEMVAGGLLEIGKASGSHWRRVVHTDGVQLGSVESLLEKQLHMQQYATYIEYVAALGRQAGKVVDQLAHTQ